ELAVAETHAVADEALQTRGAPRHDPSERERDQQRSPEVRPGVMPRASFEPAADAAPGGARETIALSAMDPHSAEEEDEHVEKALDHAYGTRPEQEGGGHGSEQHRQKHDAKYDEKSEKQLAPCPGVGEGLAVEADCGPDPAPNLGLAPEVIDADR